MCVFQDLPFPAVPLPLEGTCNTRELGGCTLQGGGQFRLHRCLRSDALDQLTVADKRFLLDYGVRCVIDLRSSEEVARSPGCLGPADGVVYEHVQLLDAMQSNHLQGPLPQSLSELYVALLERAGTQLVRVLRCVAAQPRDAVLFHCAVGKDRTGVIAMLLLLLAGASNEAVCADYAASEAYLAPLFARQRAQLAGLGIEVPDFVFCSPAEEMRRTLAYLQARWGTVGGYLAAVGMPATEQAALRGTLVAQPAAKRPG